MAGLGLPAGVCPPLGYAGVELIQCCVNCPWGRTFFIGLFERVGALSKFRAGDEWRQRLSPGVLLSHTQAVQNLTAAVVSGRSLGEGTPGLGMTCRAVGLAAFPRGACGEDGAVGGAIFIDENGGSQGWRHRMCRQGRGRRAGEAIGEGVLRRRGCPQTKRCGNMFPAGPGSETPGQLLTGVSIVTDAAGTPFLPHWYSPFWPVLMGFFDSTPDSASWPSFTPSPGQTAGVRHMPPWQPSAILSPSPPD